MPPPTIDSYSNRPSASGGLGRGSLVLLALVLLISARTLSSTIIDYQWWKEVGQTDAWWAQFLYQTGPLVVSTIIAFAFLWTVHARAMKAAGTGLSHHPLYARLSALAILFVSWIVSASLFSDWDVARFFASRGASTITYQADPVFNKTLPFYFFDLPFYESLASFAVALLIIATLAYWVISQVWSFRSIFRTVAPGQFEIDWQNLTSGGHGVRILGAAALVALAVRFFLNRYDMAFEDHTFLTGVEYVADNVRLPLNWALVFATLGAAGLVLVGRFKLALIALVFIPLQNVIPAIVNSVYVKPNELTLQRPYIQYHMDATRAAYGLKGSAKPGRFDATQGDTLDVNKHRHLLDNVRLWDWQAFHDTVSQIQPLRPYIYVDTDVDRYTIDGNIQQVMLTPRELDIDQLGEARNRWPNRHVVYTHGYGIVAADANRITPDGLPSLFIQDAPPKVSVPGMKLDRPEIYYGEIAHEPVFVRTGQPEFNYPSGSDNVHSRYEGTGGFPIGSMGMRLIAAIAYADPNIVLTSYIQPESRMMIRRKVIDRLQELAGFLVWDGDPYLVLSNGRLVWMADGYSTSRSHPYSQPVRTAAAGSINYVRNSVKATVDAYSGETRLYVFDDKDPIINAWQQLYPKLLLNSSAMPADLRSHARYPEWLFRVQAEIHLSFHMQDAEAFYNKVDVWDIASRQGGQTTRGGGTVERSTTGKSPMDPAYLIADVPGGVAERPEFLLTLPFTPRGKDNLIGMMIGRSDGEHLGELAFVELPKERLYYGPMQIESRINQEQTISKDLTLWNQQGSQVLRGQMVVLPVGDKIFYAQPIYLQAREARMPQLKKVVVAVGNRLIYTDTYEQALIELGGAPAKDRTQTSSDTGPVSSTAPPPGSQPGPAPSGADLQPRIQNLRQRMERYRQFSSQGKWAEAGRELEAIEAELRK